MITLSKSNFTFSFYFSRKMEMYSMRAVETIVQLPKTETSEFALEYKVDDGWWPNKIIWI